MADYVINRHFVLMISLDLMKSSEVRTAGDRSKYKLFHKRHAQVIGYMSSKSYQS